MSLSTELREFLADPRQTAMLRSRADRVFARPITMFSEFDLISSWTPVAGRDLARELLDALAFLERLDVEEVALCGELALIGEDCYRAWSYEIDTDGAEWRLIQWSYTERRGQRTILLHIMRWDGQVAEIRTSPSGLGRLLRRLAQLQLEAAARDDIDADELREARDLIDQALEAAQREPEDNA